jgi:hypothetical protein
LTTLSKRRTRASSSLFSDYAAYAVARSNDDKLIQLAGIGSRLIG